MKTFKILLEAKPFGLFNNIPIEKLKKEGFQIVDMRGVCLDNPEFYKTILSSDAVICGNDLKFTGKLLKDAIKLKIISKIGTGCDNIDISSATKHNILVCDTAGMNRHAVADHTFALILSLARKIVYCDRSIRDGLWEHAKVLGLDIWEKTIGIIGLGSIGKCVAKRARGFNMKIVGYDYSWPSAFADEFSIEKSDIQKLCEVSDVITVHLPLTDETKGLINNKLFNCMKPTALIINTSRGSIIKESDLCIALEEERIGGAGLDVFHNEPPENSPLLKLDNVILSPHTSAFTSNSLYQMDMAAVSQIIKFYKGVKPQFTLNPEVFERVIL
jgi:D-3-phosphoglycerate dehydrogenase